MSHLYLYFITLRSIIRLSNLVLYLVPANLRLFIFLKV